jgi:serine/threonine-protein kinase
LVAGDRPSRLGRYEIQDEIGRGMMGIVYRALDPDLGRTVALKTVHLAFAIAESDREAYEKRFLAEARVAAGLSHPGLVVVHDVGRDAGSGTPFIALEYLEGRTLAERLARQGPLPWREAARVAARVAEALHHAHRQGIVHRDVKPANVMLLGSGEAKLMDFGIAKIPMAQLTTAGESFGTPAYMSPEQVGGAPVDGRSDVFSLGAVLYQTLTGRRPFEGESVAAILGRVLHGDPLAPSTLVADVPAALDGVVARALAKSPDARYPTAQALAEDLHDVLEGRGPRHAVGATARSGEGTRRTLVGENVPVLRAPAHREADWTRRALGVAAVVLAGALGFALMRPRAEAPAGGAATGPTPAAAPASQEPSSPEPTSDSGSLLGRLPFFRAPARLEIVFQHSLRTGTIKVWVDDDLVIEDELEARVIKKILGIKRRKGRFEATVDVPPGEREIKVQVQSGNFWGARRIRGTFTSGETRTLEVNKGGLPLIDKDLSLGWM